MSVSSSSSSLLPPLPPSSSYSYPTRLISIDPRIYCETINELHSYLTTCKRGYLTQAELFRYYRQRHDNAEIPYRLLGYKSLLDLLASDQRLFAVDLRCEPAHIYSAVKIRQEKRDQRHGNTTLNRQHHSTNTIDEHQHQQTHSPNTEYTFFDHHVPLTKQLTKESPQTTDEQEIFHQTDDGRLLTPKLESNHFPKKLWHTPELDQQKTSNEENQQENLSFQSNPFLPLPTNHQTDNEYQLNKRLIMKDPSIISCSPSILNRSISTSTTNLSTCKCSSTINSTKIFFFLSFCLLFVLIYLYKTCFI